MKAPQNSPPGRYGHRAAYSAQSDRIVLFGGVDNIFLGDTWEWDGTNWIAMTPSGATPQARSHGVMSTSPRYGNVMLFGGLAVGGQLQDTWEWNGGSWNQLFPNASPFATSSSGLGRGSACLDSLRQRVVALFEDGSYWEFRIPVATVDPYGQGCAGVTTVLQPQAGSLPIIGHTFASEVLVLPAGATFAFADYGLSRTNVGPFSLPLPLDSFGMPGCHLYHDAVLLLAMQVSGNTATHQLTLPTATSLEGQHLFVQALVGVAGANVADLVVTNALDLTLANQ